MKTGQQAQKLKLDHFPTLYTKINSKWTKELNARQETIKILEENVGSKLFDLGQSNFLLDMSLEAREIKKELFEIHQDKNFCTEKETINETKRQTMELEKIFANDTSDKVLVSKIYTELIKLAAPRWLSELSV